MLKWIPAWPTPEQGVKRRGRSIARSLWMMAVCACVTSCSSVQAPAPVVYYGAGGGGKATPVSVAHTVSAANTVSRAKLPAPQRYTVRKGDTMTGIARLFGTTPDALARVNGLPPRIALHAGRIMRLPPSAIDRRVIDPPQVRTASIIANPRYKTPAASSDAAWKPPQPIGITAPAAPVSPSRIEKEILITPLAAASIATPEAFPAATIQRQPLPEAVIAAVASLSDNKTVLPSTVIPARAGSMFGWPVRGRLISGYGGAPDGRHNDGINIATAKNQPVRAADNGVVAYADGRLKGYGNLVLIRHAGGWMTAYAHLNKIDVRPGQAVRKGDRLGIAGSTGGVSRPQLHFEVRRGTEPLNPVAFLEPQGT